MQLQPVAFENSNEPQPKVRSFPVKSGPGPVFFRSIGLDFKTLQIYYTNRPRYEDEGLGACQNASRGSLPPSILTFEEEGLGTCQNVSRGSLFSFLRGRKSQDVSIRVSSMFLFYLFFIYLLIITYYRLRIPSTTGATNELHSMMSPKHPNDGLPSFGCFFCFSMTMEKGLESQLQLETLVCLFIFLFFISERWEHPLSKGGFILFCNWRYWFYLLLLFSSNFFFYVRKYIHLCNK